MTNKAKIDAAIAAVKVAMTSHGEIVAREQELFDGCALALGALLEARATGRLSRSNRTILAAVVGSWGADEGPLRHIRRHDA